MNEAQLSKPQCGAVDLTGQTALVTGATSGLGARFARVLAAAGARVAITGRRIERLATLEAEINGQGGQALAVALDVTDPDSVMAGVEETETRLGAINILVNNAGMNVEGPVVDMALEDFDRVMGTNLRGPFFLAQQVGKRMIAGGQGGRIVNIASIGAFNVLPGLSAYCISKAAIAMMTRCLAREWARHEINVNAICPGYIRTEINADWFETEGGQKQIKGFPRRRLGVEEDLDGTLLLLVAPQSRFINGALMTIDDGQSLA